MGELIRVSFSSFQCSRCGPLPAIAVWWFPGRPLMDDRLHRHPLPDVPRLWRRTDPRTAGRERERERERDHPLGASLVVSSLGGVHGLPSS